MAFYEPLRQALHSYSPGVHEAGPPATPARLRALGERLGRPLPSDYADLLSSWNGLSLFHELIVLFSTEDAELSPPAPGQLRIGRAEDCVLWLDQAGRLRLLEDESAPEPIVCGSSLPAWLQAVLLREALVFDREGEFRDVFAPDGTLLDGVRRKRIAVARKHDPGSALFMLEEAELFIEEQQHEQAVRLLEQAVALDPEAGPARELLRNLRLRAALRVVE